ncbi:bifunctional glutamine-synthetase adenylyltransferase/deadenyltransferase [Moraxella macacae 0408225]|uniref:Bifunctional glutamine synthetase adenylyltransferase/adenylyl-removing enzyme n=1 Tax=Moraxella macacae 0408225 TaxID=1230338 RepID=L2F7N6_9GAMM|nr:bifunctional [glutamate--ammonia ligase]-adenylyl-L-tyrosine phosphorylase/[glutamate--ammonia-ligase] adenylyltransferase [Moraxella macacae]ELA08478.1 bifunctional glutamine-synthetase adenylyltransferase/deadenyltransferase [Moraxella macacae 0408225]
MSVLPTLKDIDVLQQASQFGFQFWQNKPTIAKSFIKSYPLNQVLNDQIIKDLIQDYTLDDECCVADEMNVMKGLRILRNLLMLRWIWQDALGLISLEQLTWELSHFADECLIFAKSYAYQNLTNKYGEPYCYPYCYDTKNRPQKDDLAMIAMGKMGAEELNLSSDIDLIFVHQGQGETGFASFNCEHAQKSIDTKKFMTKWAQKIIELLDKPTQDGFVFRIDMRLRPWGEGSDLVIHLPALEKYFAQHGRAWERFAWLKARIVNSIDFTDNLQALIQPFVFRYYVDYSAFSALREMKLLIENQVAQRQDSDNIKLGAGGIRDIEFIVQSFQLIYGGRVLALKVKNCLKALQKLHEFGYLDTQTYENLVHAYRFLRRLEHGIQAINDEQTQRLPTDPIWQQNLAHTLGFSDWAALLTHLNQYRLMVKIPFDNLVTERKHPSCVVEIKHDENLDQLTQRLTYENQQKLANFWQSNLVKKLSDEAKKRLNTAYPLLVYALLQVDTAVANVALPRLLNLLESINRRSIYLVMLSENPHATSKLIPMLAASPWIATELANHPVLLDSFLREKYRYLPNKDELRDILRQQLLRVEPGDEEGLLNAFRFFKKTQVLAVATSDIVADRPIMKVSDSLTFIAEVVLEKALKRAFDDLVKKHGYPLNKQGEPINAKQNGFAVIGYGKLGGLEMSYSSDLDLVFLHDIDEQAMTIGNKPVSGMQFASRLAQRLMNYLSTQTRDGRAYEVDMRLRPSGQAGMLVVSCHAYQMYQEQKAWVWEHQALVRARAICGDKQVMAKFNDIRQKVLCMPRQLDAVRIDVGEMRHKMQDHLGTKNHAKQQGKFHLKQDTGGMVDIEFIAQFAVLAYANAYPCLSVYSDNVRIFEVLGKTDLLDRSICQRLIECYLILRAKTHTLALAEQSVVVDERDWHELRTFVDKQWQTLIGQRFDKL